MTTTEETLTLLAASFGLMVTRVTEMPECAYEPGHIYCLTHTGRDNNTEYVSNLAHDIAHFLLASPERRYLQDFGLGPSPDSFENPPRHESITSDEAYQEELRASALGILIEHWAKHDVTWTMEHHNWEDIEDTVKHLREVPFLAAQGDEFAVFSFCPELARQHVSG